MLAIMPVITFRAQTLTLFGLLFLFLVYAARARLHSNGSVLAPCARQLANLHSATRSVRRKCCSTASPSSLGFSINFCK